MERERRRESNMRGRQEGRKWGELNILTPQIPPPPCPIYQCSWLSLKFKWQEKKKEIKRKRNLWLWKGGGGLLRKRPAIYVLVLCKYYMSSTYAQLFGITSTGWVYYFRNHALFMERHDLLPDTPLSLLYFFFHPLSFSLYLSFSHSFLLSISLSLPLLFTLYLWTLNWLSLLNNYKAARPKWRCL